MGFNSAFKELKVKVVQGMPKKQVVLQTLKNCRVLRCGTFSPEEKIPSFKKKLLLYTK
jgi:hypothetical protein